MLPRTTRPLTLGASVALVTAGLLLTTTSPAGAARRPSTVGLTLSAYGTQASVGPISSGRTAVLSACSTAAGTSYEQQVEASDLGGGLGKVGAVVTSGTRKGDKITVTSTTGATTLLGGLIEAQAVRSTSVSELSGSSLRSSGSSIVTGLKIAGESRVVPTGIGARIDVPKVARITFNNQKTTKTKVSKRLTVEALRIDLLKGNKLGLDTGTIVISSSTSGASKATYFSASGQAYGTDVAAGSLVASGPTAYVGMPCGGTGGEVIKNKIAKVSLPGVLKVGAVSSTGQSKESKGTTASIFSDKVSDVNLLGGAVTADAVRARSTSTRSASGLKSSDSGTEISNLKVLGRRVKVSSKANSTIDVAGLGTLTLHKTVKRSTGLDVVGLELTLGSDRGGAKAGTVVQVAVAKSRVAAH
jgi:hypothetical protein